MTWGKDLIERIKAWRRGEQRIAPPGVRGRIYSRRAEEPPGEIAAVAKPTLSIAARVYRAATDTWEDLGTITKE